MPRRKEHPAVSETGGKEAAARKRRLAAALRENLRKRKAQSAARQAGPGESGGPGPGRRARRP